MKGWKPHSKMLNLLISLKEDIFNLQFNEIRRKDKIIMIMIIKIIVIII